MHAVTLKKLALATLVCTATLSASAQGNTADCGLRIATGPKTGVYTQLARDIQKVCGHVTNLCQVPSTGGLQNLMALSASEADIGFAQLDLLQQIGRSEQNLQELQAIMPMHANLLHVITLKAGSRVNIAYFPLTAKEVPLSGSTKVFSRFSDLAGAKVALVGSAKLLGQTLNNQLGNGMTLVESETDAQAIASLQNNEVQAVFTTGGWPYPAVSMHASNSGLMLADFDIPVSAPFTTSKRNYANLGAYNWKFLATPNLLLTRPFKPTGDKGKLVSALQSCILSRLDELQEGAYHAVWKEIRAPQDTLGVTRWEGSKGGMARTAKPGQKTLQGQRE